MSDATPPPPPLGQSARQGAQPPPPAAATRPDPPGTVGSLVWAIIGFNLLPVIGSIIAVVMGRNARSRAQQAGQPDPSMARAGRILGWIGIALAVVGLVVALLAVVIGVALVDQGLQDLNGQF